MEMTMTPDLTQNPDIAECFTYRDNPYRVTSWYRELPMTPPERDQDTPEFLHEMLVDMWNEAHPDPSKEHKLLPCTREEADWVSGAGVCGCVARIQDITREGRYVQWSDQMIQDARESTLQHLQLPNFKLPFYINKRGA